MAITDFLFKELREHAIASEKQGFGLAKYAVKQYLWNVRRTIIPSKARVFPNFIIRAQKSGTSSLYNNLVTYLKTVFDFIDVQTEEMAPYRRERVKEKYPPMSEHARAKECA